MQFHKYKGILSLHILNMKMLFHQIVSTYKFSMLFSDRYFVSVGVCNEVAQNNWIYLQL